MTMPERRPMNTRPNYQTLFRDLQSLNSLLNQPSVLQQYVEKAPKTKQFICKDCGLEDTNGRMKCKRCHSTDIEVILLDDTASGTTPTRYRVMGEDGEDLGSHYFTWRLDTEPDDDPPF